LVGKEKSQFINLTTTPSQILEVVDEKESHENSSFSSLSQPLFWHKDDRLKNYKTDELITPTFKPRNRNTKQLIYTNIKKFEAFSNFV